MKAIIDDRVKGSAREIIDQEEEIEVRIKQARLEMKINYRSTLDFLNNDLKNAREELARCDATFKERVTLIEKKAEKKHISTIQTPHEDLVIVICAIRKKEKDYKKEKTLLMNAKDKLKNQLNDSVG